MPESFTRIELEDGRSLLLVQWVKDGKVYALIAPSGFEPIDGPDLFNNTEPLNWRV